MSIRILNPQSLKWDDVKLRFVNSRGQVLDPSDVRNYIDRLVGQVSARLYNLGYQVTQGNIRVSRWQSLMAKEVKNLHIAAFTIGAGGRTQLEADNVARLNEVVNFQLKHLRDFAMSLPALSERDGRIAPRAESYGTAAIGTYENSQLDRNIKHGLSIARRVTAHGSRSCDPCIDEEDIGWQDINEIRHIGDTPCGARCNCGIEYEAVQ